MLFVKIALILLALSSGTAKPVNKKLNFNIFLLTPKNSTDINVPSERDSERSEYVKSPVKVLFSTNGVSRFPPILEYIVQRIQGMFSVYVHEDQSPGHAATSLLTNSDLQLLASTSANVTGVNQPPDTSENEVSPQEDEDAGATHGVDGSGLPNVVVKPSSLHPGTYEVEISVVVDDGQPSDGDE